MSLTFHIESPGAPCPHFSLDNDYIDFTLKELKFIFKLLKGGKAPGVDGLDFNIWRRIFELDLEIMATLFNLTMKLDFFRETCGGEGFPSCLRLEGTPLSAGLTDPFVFSRRLAYY